METPYDIRPVFFSSVIDIRLMNADDIRISVEDSRLAGENGVDFPHH